MIQNKYQLIVNIKSKGYTGAIPSVTANDNIVFDIQIYDGATPFDLTGVSRFTLVSMRKDNLSVIREGTLVNGVIEFVLGSSETLESGRVDATVQLYDANNKRVSSAPLVYNVISDPSLSGSLPADDKTLVMANESLLTDAINKANNADTRISNIVAQAGTDNTEIVDGRQKADGTTYTTLRDRLNASDVTLSNKANQTDLNTTNTNLGDLTDLKTNDKTSLVNAVNENAMSLAQKAQQLAEISILPDSTIKGDGVSDDTAAIQAILNKVPVNATANGIKVKLPSGKYKITSLNIPIGVTIEGDDPFDNANRSGTYLYCVDTVNPAILLNSATQLKNVGFYYPNQYWDSVNSKPGIAYPATIFIQQDAIRMKIEDIMFINAYIGIDANRHHEILILENVQGYCISQGLITDYSSDIDRFHIVHFNYNTIKNVGNYPNASDFGAWTRKNGIAFTIQQCDWTVMTNCFCWGYRKGFYLTSSTNGIPSGLHINKCGADACGIDVLMTSGYGVNIVDCFFTHLNGFTAGADEDIYALDLSGTSVTIANCVFWGCDRSVIHANTATSRIIGNHFKDYGNRGVTEVQDYRAVIVEYGTCIINGNTFEGESTDHKYGILLKATLLDVTISGNTFKDYIISAVIASSGGSVPSCFIDNNSFNNCSGQPYAVTATSYYMKSDKNISTTGYILLNSFLQLGNIASATAKTNSIYVENNTLKFKDSAGTVHTINIT